MSTATATAVKSTSAQQGRAIFAVSESENAPMTSSVDRMNTVAASFSTASVNLNRQRRRVMAAALRGLAPLTLEEREEFAGRDGSGKSVEIREIEGSQDVGRRYSVCGCMRSIAFGKGSLTAIQKASGRVHMKGINRCGSVWTCAECAQIIEAHRGEEVKLLIERAREQGFRLFMITYTFPHTIHDSCKDSMNGLSDALRKCRQRRKYRNAQEMLGFVGLVRSTEVTHGSNGWHTHVHEIWVCNPESDSFVPGFAENSSTIKAEIYPQWKAAAVSVFGKARAPSYEHGLDVREVWSDTDYTNKLPDQAAAKAESGKKRWGGDAEMTKSVNKRGKSSSTIWELMDNLSLYRAAGNDDMALVIQGQLEDYARGTYRKRRMYWTPTRGEKLGLRDRFGLRAEQTDEEIVNDAGEPVEGQEPDQVEVSMDVEALPEIARRNGMPIWVYLERLQDTLEERNLLDVLKDDGWVLRRLADREDGVPRWYAGAGLRLVHNKS